ncbi:hypothetical protein L5515_002664 [Caenorhabditis briggsae]|uniref:F-box domain-containing protein n=1 Tax=Caenorhabditis briggsae TaxID=6238 RepID=A0AAE9J5P1_CAEBR|nr:hypothetical protein L5515_002664 [Caenorhabditis briggsae]
MPIALLKFPIDFLRDVFKLCDPFQLYCLSKCSKRTQRSIKLSGTRNWKIFSGSNRAVIHVDDWRYSFQKAEKPEAHFQQDNFYKSSSIQCPDGDVDLFFILLDTFGIRLVGMLSIDLCNFESVSKKAKILIERDIEIEEFCIENTRGAKDAVHIMPLVNRLNITEEFECWPRFLCGFHYQLDKYPKKIFINWSYWFDINQLLNSTCVRMVLDKSILSNQHIDVFLRKWNKAGEFPNLRWLQIASKKLDNRSPILGMIPPIQSFNSPTIFIRGTSDEFVENAVRVTKEDGTVGWLKVELGRWPELKFLVSNPST